MLKLIYKLPRLAQEPLKISCKREREILECQVKRIFSVKGPQRNYPFSCLPCEPKIDTVVKVGDNDIPLAKR